MRPKRTILCVDDNEQALSIRKVMLETRGYRVVACTSGQQALEAFRQGGVDLVLTDLLMPGMDGWHFRREQQHDPALAAIPVVVCSGTGDADLHAAALGAIGFIDKPIDPDSLLDTIRRVLGPARA